jgi:2-haloacid dehalogenase
LIVVFDIGNVLLRWDRRNLYRKAFDDEARMERFLATALDMDFVSHTDTAPDFAAAVEARARAFPEFAHELRLFHERGADRRERRPAAAPQSRRPAGARAEQLRRRQIRPRPRLHEFLDAFDVAVISGHVGAVKPEARIYEILFERAGAAPGELLFIDDSPANVRAAEALGMPTIHFRPGVDLERELKARGALP